MYKFRKRLIQWLAGNDISVLCNVIITGSLELQNRHSVMYNFTWQGVEQKGAIISEALKDE